MLFNFTSLISQLSILTSLFSHKTINSTEVDSPIHISANIVESLYSNPDISCYMVITPIRSNHYLPDPNEPKKGLKYIYNNDHNTLYPPEEFISQYDKRFNSSCYNMKAKMNELSKLFEKDFNAACQKALSVMPINYQLILDNAEKRQVLKLSNKIIPTYHKVKCILQHYDYDGNCQNECSRFMESVMRSFEPLLLHSDEINADESRVICNSACKEKIANSKNDGIGALNDSYNSDEYCRSDYKYRRCVKCGVSQYDYNDCDSDRVDAYITKRRRVRSIIN